LFEVIQPGMIFINGLAHAVNTPIFNIFDVLKALRTEVQHLSQLTQLGLSSSSTNTLLHMARGYTESVGKDVRVDIYRGAKGALHHLNNVEKDPQYQQWPKSLHQLLYPSWQLHTISLNLYSLTLIIG